MDDMLIECKERIEIENLKRLLKTAFRIKDLGTARKMLGVKLLKIENKELSFYPKRSVLRRY